MLPGAMLPGRMIRQCTEVDTFVINNGVDSYQKTFQPMNTVEELLQDENMSKWNSEHEERFGPSINDNLIAKFIEHWGVDQYKVWCARESTYDLIISNPLFALAQQKYLEKHKDESNEIPVGIQGYNGIREYNLSQDPFRREFRDHKGVPVPEPPTYPTITHPFGDQYELYIKENGIINYMIKVTSTIPLETLLNRQVIAMWQKCYINKLEQEKHLF